MTKINNIFSHLLLLIPLFLITGPAIPDIIITLAMIFGLLYLISNKKILSIFKENLSKVSLLFWISLIIISFFSLNKEKSFQDSIIFLRFLLMPILIYFLFFFKDRRIKNALLLIFLLVIFVSIDTLFQFFNYSSEFGFGNDLLGFKSNWYGRLTGPFGDELVPGAYVSKFGLIGYAFLLSKNKLNKNNFIQVIYLATILIVCFASGERMAFATFSLGLLVLLIFFKKKRLVIGFSILLGLGLILLTYKFHPFYNDYDVIESSQYHQGLKIEKKFKCEENQSQICTKVIIIQPSIKDILSNFSSSAYGEIYLLSYKMFKDNPITGIGLSNFEFLCKSKSEYKKMMKNYNCASHPHNIYIQWLTEGGLITFAIFLLYLYYIINFIINNKGNYEYKLLSITIMLIMFWPIMSTGSLIKNWNGVLTFFIISICICLSRLKKNY